MGIYDRDYMKPDAKAPLTVSHARKEKKKNDTTLPLWSRLRFALWLLLHPSKR
ncbi:MAG: hypothetical protein PHG65_06830 [Kiritimatiellae bacterium]|nr:hypothetical protein [Kiritimatiellia bacterium]